MGDCFGGFSGRVFVEDSPHGGGLRFVDAAIAAQALAGFRELHDDIIAEGVPAARLSGLDPTALAAPRLVGEVIEIESAHRALEADVEFADRAFGKREHRHAGKAQAFVNSGDVFLVARNPVKGFRQREIELAILRVAHQRLDAGTHKARARDRLILVVTRDLPAFAGGTLLA